MACIDVCQAIGMSMQNMSFAQVVKIALASCLESMRQNNVIPTRSGFEYSDMMHPFKELDFHNRAAKLGVTKLVDGLGERFAPQPIVPIDPELERIKRRMDELHMKREADPANFTDAEQAEWVELCSKL